MDKTTTITTTILIFLFSIIDTTTLHIVLGNDRLVEYMYSLIFEAQSILGIILYV
jgi:hypothetical protein